MIKRYCDVCGDEIKDSNKLNGRLSASKVVVIPGGENITLNVEVMTGLNGISNAGDFCKYCVIDAVNICDNRPREMA